MEGLVNRQYVGARYVPKLMGEWNKALQYEALSIVTYLGNSFTSKIPVPSNIEITNEDYWVNTGNYNAQVEQYRAETEKVKNTLKYYENYVTPQMYGAKADGVNDDTIAVNKAIQENNVIFFPVGTYSVNFGALNLTRKTLIGASNVYSIIKSRNSGVPFAIIGRETSLSNLSFNVSFDRPTPILNFITYNGVKTDCRNFDLYNLNFADIGTIKNSIPFYFNAINTGCVGGNITNVGIDYCGEAIRFDFDSTTAQGWLTNLNITNVLVNAPSKHGLYINNLSPSAGGFQLSHATFSNISVIGIDPNCICYELDGSGWSLIEPRCFNDTPANTALTGLKLNATLPTVTYSYGRPLSIIRGGFIEGLIDDTNINKYYVDNVRSYRYTISDGAVAKKFTVFNNYNEMYNHADKTIPISEYNFITPENCKNNPALGNSYYLKTNTLTELHIGVDELSTGSYVKIFTLPSGCRPVSDIYGVSIGKAVTQKCAYRIDTKGNVYCYVDAGDSISFDVTFNAYS